GSGHRSIGQAAKPDRDWPLHRWRHDTQVVESTAEAHEVFRPQEAEDLDLLGLSCAPRLPVHIERLVFDVIPPHPDAEPQAPTAQQIGLGRLLAMTPVWRCGAISTPLDRRILVVTAAKKPRVTNVSWKGSFSL